MTLFVVLGRDAAHGDHAMPPAAVLPHAGTFWACGAVRLWFSTGGALDGHAAYLELFGGHRPSDGE